MTEVTIRQNKHGEPVMTIRVTGNEIFRFAWYMANGPVDYIYPARKAFRYLRRRWGSEQFRKHDRMLTGGRVVKYGWQVDERREL